MTSLSPVAFLVALATAAAPSPPVVPQPPPSAVPVFASVARLTLPTLRRPIELVVDPLGARIELRTADVRVLAPRIRAAAPDICPRVEETATAVVLHCETRRLDVAIATERGKTYLDIRALRGLPFRGPDQELFVFYDPARLPIADPCPGTNPAARGECALQAGNEKNATLEFRLAMNTPQRDWAMLRLGDLAVHHGDITGALALYVRAGNGPFGRLAMGRVCELTGGCLEGPRTAVFDTGGLSEPFVSELMLRGARAYAFRGQTASSIHRLGTILAGMPTTGFCDEVGKRFCRRIVLDALEHADKTSGLAALEIYLGLPHRMIGDLAVEMGRAAAEQASAMGAPVFGGNVLASVFSSVGTAELPEYLLRTAELYSRGRDGARARALIEYAETRLQPRQMSDRRWVAVRAQVSGTDDTQHILTADESRKLDELATLVARDVSAAFGLMAHGR